MAERALVSLARLEAWVYYFINVVPQKESCRNYRQREYTEAYANFLRLATPEVTGSARLLALYWHRNEAEFDSDTRPIQARKNFAFSIP